MVQAMGLQRVRHNLATEQQQRFSRLRLCLLCPLGHRSPTPRSAQLSDFLAWPTNSVLFHSCSACPVVYLPFASTSMEVLGPDHYCLTTPLAPKNQPAVLIGKETKPL